MKNGNDYYVTIINTDTEARNVTIDTDGLFTKLTNQETAEEFSNQDGIFNIGILDSYEIAYFGFEAETVDGLVVQLKLNENSGTTAHDTSGNGNNGTISGATWNNDGIDVTLTENTDYTLSGSTFTIINDLYAWTGVNASWNYNYILSDNADYALSGNAATGLAEFGNWFDILVIVSVAVSILTLLFIAFNRNSGEVQVSY